MEREVEQTSGASLQLLAWLTGAGWAGAALHSSSVRKLLSASSDSSTHQEKRVSAQMFLLK